ETERQLMSVIPRKNWRDAHHWLIFHGRRVCHARKPDCAACALKPDCRYMQPQKRKQAAVTAAKGTDARETSNV
ncbi:MAG: hypothetical protein LLF96_13375, partial [Eubacteriales bacterium]|nr:hypothetical protein [Eubacteriales bacterium]